jgi:hypothetical protein
MGITLCYNEKKGKIMCEGANKNIEECLIKISWKPFCSFFATNYTDFHEWCFIIRVN